MFLSRYLKISMLRFVLIVEPGRGEKVGFLTRVKI